MQSYANDSLVVPTDALVAVLMPWILDHTDYMCSGSEELAALVGREAGFVRKVIQGQHQYTSLSKADVLLTAIDMQGTLASGRIPVLMNPSHDPKRWRARMKARGVTKPEELLT